MTIDKIGPQTVKAASEIPVTPFTAIPLIWMDDQVSLKSVAFRQNWDDTWYVNL
ncbi:MAG: hypothetical protein OXH93_06230 [Caldilineaceae bacterium]|nr:hypothetical protein [Caldilineaceae bacterium]MDE0461982.1 hypothetical protein [Caldilineaceae bacterium]